MPPRPPGVATERVVTHVRQLIERGKLRPGDRLPSERDLAVQIKISRPSVRAGLKSLIAMGLIEARHGAGTFVNAGPPALTSEPLRLQAALHGFSPPEMFEARRVLEVGVAGLAAERATDVHRAAMMAEVAAMGATLDNPRRFLEHDIRFHMVIAAACGNPILTTLVDMVAALTLEQRRQTVSRARDLREATELHRRIALAIGTGDPERARAAMSEHLMRAERAQALEESDG